MQISLWANSKLWTFSVARMRTIIPQPGGESHRYIHWAFKNEHIVILIV